MCLRFSVSAIKADRADRDNLVEEAPPSYLGWHEPTQPGTPTGIFMELMFAQNTDDLSQLLLLLGMDMR